MKGFKLVTTGRTRGVVYIVCAVLWMVLLTGSLATAGWGPETRLTNDPAKSTMSYWGGGKCIAATPEGNLHIVWWDSREGGNRIFHKYWDGYMWHPDEDISESDSRDPCVAVGASGEVDVSWYNMAYRSFWRRFESGAWGATKEVSDCTAENSVYPCATIDDDGNSHVAWLEGWSKRIYYRMYDGATWSGCENLSESPTMTSQPAIVSDGSGNLCVAWGDSRSGDMEIYSMRFDGTAWTSPERLTYADGYSYLPCMAVDGLGNVHMVWEDQRDGTQESYYAKYDGISWTADVLLSADDGSSSSTPKIAADPYGGVHVVWEDSRHGNGEIYYRYSPDGEGMWMPETRVSDDPAASRHPSVAADANGCVHVVWDDSRDGNDEIYYKRWTPPEQCFFVTVATNEVTSEGEVHKYDRDGNLAQVLVPDLQNPQAIAFNYYRSPNLLYTDLTGGYMQNNRNLYHMTSVGSTGITATGFGNLTGAASALDGAVYAADFDHNVIYKIDDGATSVFASISSPNDVLVSEDGHIYASAFSSGQVIKYDSEGAVDTTWSGFVSPCALAERSDGVIFVAERDPGRVSYIDTDGTVGACVDGITTPVGICFDNQNVLYVVESAGDHRVLRVDTYVCEIIDTFMELPGAGYKCTMGPAWFPRTATDRNLAMYKRTGPTQPADPLASDGPSHINTTIFTVGRPEPNPFGETTTVGFALSRPANVKITVHDIEGRAIRNLVDRPVEAGSHVITWGRTDNNGETVAPGIYFIQAEALGTSTTRKLVLVR